MTKNNKRGRGRPATAHQVQVIAVRQERPDAKKLGRAFLALALHRAQLEADAATSADADRDAKGQS